MEFGRKPWLSKSYHEMMSKTSNSAIWAQIKQKHSEFEKPYLYKMGQYAEMQHYFPNLPGLSGIPSFSLSGIKFDDMRFDHPWMGRPVDNASAWPWVYVVFYCGGDPCWCPNQTKCFDMGCTYPIDHIEPTWSWSCQGLTFQAGNGQLCITAGDEDSVGWSCNIDVVMAAKVYSHKLQKVVTVYGERGNMRINKCRDDECCAYDLAYDYGTSAATIAQSASCTVAVTGSDGPFDWSVSGTGFTLDSATTTGLTNTLNADASACGSATITVTDACSRSTTGYVRCTTGQWVEKSRSDWYIGYWNLDWGCNNGAGAGRLGSVGNNSVVSANTRTDSTKQRLCWDCTESGYFNNTVPAETCDGSCPDGATTCLVQYGCTNGYCYDESQCKVVIIYEWEC